MSERNQLRTATRTAVLSAVSNLNSFVSTVDNEQSYPFASWGTIEQRPLFDDKTYDVNVYDVQIDIWDRTRTPASVETILDQIKTKLHRQTIEVSGNSFTYYQTNSFYIYDSDPTIIHGIYRVRVESGHPL